jgi:hypothetical protein
MMRVPFAIATFLLLGAGCGEDGGRRPEEGTAAPPRPVDQACVEPKTAEEAVAAFARLEKREAEIPYLCAKLMPELGAALIGGTATEVGCAYTHVLHRCRAYKGNDAAPAVLGALGWAAKAPAERARLAMAWTRGVVFPRAEQDVFLESTTIQFARAMQPFSPPTAEPTADGGARVTVWIEQRGFRDHVIEQHEILFSRDGAVVAEKRVAKLDREAPPLSEFTVAVKVEGKGARLTAAAIQEKLGGLALHRAAACHEMALADNPGAAGTMKLRLEIDSYGKVVKLDVAGLGIPAIDECVQGLAEKWHFPPATDSAPPVRATIELALRPRQAPPAGGGGVP